MKKVSVIVVVILALTFCSCKMGARDGRLPEQEEDATAGTKEGALDQEGSEETDTLESEIAELLGGMTVHEQICQLLVVSPESILKADRVTETDERMKQALQELPVGGILYGKENFLSREQVKTMLDEVQNDSRLPLLLTCDEEGGRVNRLMDTVGTTYVGPMLSYQDQGESAAFENACTIASDMYELGFNVDMAPVADVWSNPRNTVIGDRAYSDDFEQAATLVASAVDGFHSGGVATTLKHFPGHGDTSEDSHEGAVYITKTLEELRQKELLPFQAGIDAGSDLVMVGHLILSDVDRQPAPFSEKIVTGLLREELGFDGVVITDSLQMKAITDFYGSGEAACKAVAAGVDLLLCPEDPYEAAAALEEAVEEGTISESRIKESVCRILRMKAERGMMNFEKWQDQ